MQEMQKALSTSVDLTDFKLLTALNFVSSGGTACLQVPTGPGVRVTKLTHQPFFLSNLGYNIIY